jgi:hypothetical protein
MGTSRAAQAPPSRKWNNVIGTLKNPDRNANAVLNVAFSVAVNAMSSINPLAAPIAFGVSEGLRFTLDVRDRGIEHAAKQEAVRIAGNYVAPTISNDLWNVAASKMDPSISNSAFGRLAEIAFKKTMTQVMTKGASALVAEGDE